MPGAVFLRFPTILLLLHLVSLLQTSIPVFLKGSSFSVTIFTYSFEFNFPALYFL